MNLKPIDLPEHQPKVVAEAVKTYVELLDKFDAATQAVADARESLVVAQQLDQDRLTESIRNGREAPAKLEEEAARSKLLHAERVLEATKRVATEQRNTLWDAVHGHKNDWLANTTKPREKADASLRKSVEAVVSATREVAALRAADSYLRNLTSETVRGIKSVNPPTWVSQAVEDLLTYANGDEPARLNASTFEGRMPVPRDANGNVDYTPAIANAG